MNKIKHIVWYSIIAIILLTVVRVYPGIFNQQMNKIVGIIICILAILCVISLLRLGMKIVALFIGIMTFSVYGMDLFTSFGANFPSILNLIQTLLRSKLG